MISLQIMSMDSLSQNDVLAFVGRVKPILAAAYPSQTPDVVTKFYEIAENYMIVLQSQTVKISGAEIEACDHLADDEWRALDFQIKASACQHFNAEQREAALSIQKIFSKYKDPTDMRYIKEYDILDQLLAELEKISVETLKLAKVDMNVIALRKRVEDFRTLYTNKVKPEAEEEMGLARDVRIRLNRWWEAINLEMKADSYEKADDPAFAEAVEKLNMLIDSIVTEA